MEKFDYGWREKERASGLLMEKILATYYYYFFNLINADVENCENSKSFGFICIYRCMNLDVIMWREGLCT